MAKRIAKPSSIRLTPAADDWILKWVKATDLSMSSLINRAIYIAHAVLTENKADLKSLTQQLHTQAKLTEIDRIATAKKAELRAAAKGAK